MAQDWIATAEKTPLVRRTECTTPAHNLKMMAKAAGSEADEVMLDLEDACAVSQKEGARATLVEALNTLDWKGKIRAFRPNNIHTRFFLDDMLSIVPAAGRNLDVVILPKTEDPREIYFVDQLLTHVERRAGLEVGRIGLEILIESAKAVRLAHEIATASPRVQALIYGIADYAGDIGARLGRDQWSDFVYSKQATVNAARAAGVDVIDCVTLFIRDDELCRADAERSKRMGFDGKWAIHPAQIPIINAAFTPTPEEVARAKQIVEAYAKADVEQGLGAIVIGDEMVDRATIRVQNRILAVAKKAGLAG
jgi:citrate lyase subunit beta/citryl-CoA lyase